MMRVKLAKMREAQGCTQKTLARAAGISQPHYSDIENGSRCPSPIVTCKIAKVLNIPEQDMFRVFYESELRHVR